MHFFRSYDRIIETNKGGIAMRTSNPSLGKKTFEGLETTYERPMTIHGTVDKTMILLFLLVGSALFAWKLYFDGTDIGGYMMMSAIGAFVVAIITIFAKKAARFTAPIYALLEGFALGGISAMYEAQWAGITTQAVLLTFGTLFCLLVAYRTKLIKATENFKLGVFAATGAIAFVYIIDLVLHFFGLSVPFIHDTGLVGILVSLGIVIVAALNLVLDFDFIEQGAKSKAPKYMEWYGAFGLMLTLVWLYLEILRLLSKLRSNN